MAQAGKQLLRTICFSLACDGEGEPKASPSPGLHCPFPHQRLGGAMPRRAIP